MLPNRFYSVLDPRNNGRAKFFEVEVALQHVHDEALLDGLAHAVFMEGVISRWSGFVEQGLGFELGRCGRSKETQIRLAGTSQGIADTLRRVCPSAKKARSTEAHNSARKRGFELPHISRARQDFEQHWGCVID